VDESLSASVMQGNSIQVRLGDLDIIPEYLVIADFQRLNAGLLALLALDSGDPGFPISADNSQFVKRCIVPLPNEPSFFDSLLRRSKSACNSATASWRSKTGTISVSGCKTHARNSRAPMEVRVRSRALSSEPSSRPSEALRTSSRLR